MGQSSTTAGAVVWGSSEHGQLGIGSLPTEDRAVAPRLVEGLRSVPVRQVVCGGHFSASVSESGEVYTWGCGKDGQLGHGDSKDVHIPRAVRYLQSKVIRSVSCAEHHAAAVSEAGVLFTWGRGQNGRLGHGGTENEALPKAVQALDGLHVAQAACGEFHTACILQNAPHVYTWGLGLSGRLGHGDEHDRNLPTLVDALTGLQVASIACGGHHTAGISDQNWQVMTWGGGAFGKLGHGNRLAQTTPKMVVALQGKRMIQVSLGPHHSAALTQKGEVFTWGQAGRLGHASQGAEVDEMLPRQVAALNGIQVVQISCGHSHCAVVTEPGDVWAWGSSRAFGHTEQGAFPNVPTMIRVLTGKAIVNVACGVTHNIALSDYRRLNGKPDGKTSSASSRAMAPTGKDRAPISADSEDRQRAGAEAKKDATEPVKHIPSMDELRARTDGGAQNLDSLDLSPEKGHGASKAGTAQLVPEREMAFLSAELKAYQEQTLRLAKLLQETRTKLETLQNENSFLKSELEVMHQCSNDGDERLDTLRGHFNERIREMERRYNEKERAWRDTFSRLKSHLGLAGGVAEPGNPSSGSADSFGQPDASAAVATGVSITEGSADALNAEGEGATSLEPPSPAPIEVLPGTAANAAVASGAAARGAAAPEAAASSTAAASVAAATDKAAAAAAGAGVLPGVPAGPSAADAAARGRTSGLGSLFTSSGGRGGADGKS
eukprot:TRINITY_DN12943_c0_g1_i1.p1 TRINITY_DN12943_c0_g1~~TRINITY_DN12943_c0_g1_i1.p1  ORF type:complete len:719 (-),score=181.78 TRINITY_DN12943_c0_g1_i1:57-2213(-)